MSPVQLFKCVAQYFSHLPHITNENVLWYVGKPMKKVGEPKEPSKVPTFEEKVGVQKLIETN